MPDMMTQEGILRFSRGAARVERALPHDPDLIDGAPEIVLHAADPGEYLIHVPCLPAVADGSACGRGKLAANFLHQRRTVS